MRTILIFSFVIALTGCAAGQRYSECSKQYPEPQNDFWTKGAAAQTAPGPILFGSLLAWTSGEDQNAYYQWQQNVNACIDQKAASAQ